MRQSQVQPLPAPAAALVGSARGYTCMAMPLPPRPGDDCDSTVRARERSLLTRLYAALNQSHFGAGMGLLHADVEWSDDLTGQCLKGRVEIARHWMNQWVRSDIKLEALSFQCLDDAVTVDVRLCTHEHAHAQPHERTLRHVFRFQDGLILSKRLSV